MGYFWNANQEADLRVKETIDFLVKAAIQYLGDDILSIILMGSFARGEGIWKKLEERIEILSDIDLLVVLKGHKRIPTQLSEEIRRIKNKMNIQIDIRFKSSFRLRFYPKDTHTYDYLHISQVIYGRDIKKLFPRVFREDIGKSDIEALFFNRAKNNIKECSPAYLTSNSGKDLLMLNYMAAKTMFTCTDIMSIYHRNYSPFIDERIKFGRENLKTFGILPERFLEDLDIAHRFVFEQPAAPTIENIRDYWARARGYLLRLFLFANGRKNEFNEIFNYPFSLRLSCVEKIRLFYKRIKFVRVLWKRYNRFTLFRRFHPVIYCRMASLMLYMAIDKDKEEAYTRKALEYFSNLYHLENEMGKTGDIWMTLRSNLLEFHKAGLF